MLYVSVEDLIEALLLEFKSEKPPGSEDPSPDWAFENNTVKLSDVIDSIVEFADEHAVGKDDMLD